MNAKTEPQEELSRRIDAVESGYEFLLAYAAQGRDSDRGQGGGHRVREFLEAMQNSLDGLDAVVRACIAQHEEAFADAAAAFVEALRRDAETARSVVRLVLAQPDISSQLVDNMNASIHVRALLTDLFIVDEALKKRKGSGD